MITGIHIRGYIMIFSEKQGFTLIELMVVIAIIAFLSMIAVPNMLKYVSKAKRTEAYAQLASLALAEKAYFAEHGSYTSVIGGSQGLHWKPQGSYNYSYGFSSGQEGENYFIGQLKAPVSALARAKISPKGFVIIAAADIDGDGELDVISVDQDNVFTLLSDDLA